MERNVKFVWIGAIFFIILACMIGFIMWLSRFEVDTSRYTYYYAYSLNEIGGIGTNTPIRYKGISVGRVLGISFKDIEEGKIEIKMIIDNKLVLKDGTKIVVSSQGLAGANYLALLQGDGEVLKADSDGRKVLQIDRGNIEKFMNKASDIGEDMALLLRNINNTFDEESLKHISQMTKELSALSMNLHTISIQMSQDLQKGEYSIREILTPTLLQMQGSLQDMSKFFKEASELIQKINKNPYESLFGKVENTKNQNKGTKKE